MSANFTDDDEGKTVVSADGDKIGTVAEVRGDTVHVDPESGMTDTIKNKLGWGEADEDTYPLTEDRVDTVTDDEIRLQGM